MENKVISKKAEIAKIIKIFKQNLELKSSEMNERRLKILKRCIKRNEKIVNNKDQTDIEHINDELDTIKRVFNGYFSTCSIDYTPKPIINSTFIESRDWIKNKKCTINPQNFKDNKCFQYSIIIFLYHKEIKNNPERIGKSKPFINNLIWENINFLPQEQNYKQFEMNNKSMTLNILKVDEQEKRSHLYKSEHNKVILLMTSDNKCNFSEKTTLFGC